MLPRRPIEHETNEPSGEAETMPSSRRRPRGAITMLMVDDDEDFRRIWADVLQLKGVKVHEAASGEEALRFLDDNAPDVVLLDHRMPGLQGTEVIDELRARGVKVPIILMTDAKSVRKLADTKGITHWIGKPFDLDRLQGVLELAIGNRPEHRRHVEEPRP